MLNLIKDDFSDFTAYGGATVTRNKTFPIDVFKGGRNILPISNVVPHSRVQNVMGYFNGRENTIKSYNDYTENTASWGLEDGQVYTFVCDICTLDDMTWSSRVFYVNSITNGLHNVTKTNAMEWTRLEVTFTYKTGGSTNVLHIYPNPSGSTYYLSNQKIIKGVNLEEPYSPAPEDGYDYTGSDGAYHIETSGGTDIIKAFKNIPLPNIGETFNMGINVHPFTDMQVGSYLGRETLTPNVTKKVELVQTINVPVSYGMQFITIGVTDPLDFIASNPKILISGDDEV